MLSGIDHVNLVVTDLAAMTQFYCQVLGLRVTKRVTISGGWVENVVGLTNVKANVIYLEADQGPRIEFIEYVRPIGVRPPEVEKANTVGIRHLAFRVEDIDTAVAAVVAAGAQPLSLIQQVPNSQVAYAGGVRKRLVYFHDPEGNLLEFCEYR